MLQRLTALETKQDGTDRALDGIALDVKAILEKINQAKGARSLAVTIIGGGGLIGLITGAIAWFRQHGG